MIASGPTITITFILMRFAVNPLKMGERNDDYKCLMIRLVTMIGDEARAKEDFVRNKRYIIS